MTIFAERVKGLIKLHKISQAQLAEKLEISPARLNSYLSGKAECGYALLAATAQALNTSVDYLLGLSASYNSEAFVSKYDSRYAGISDGAMAIDIPLYLSGESVPSGTLRCDALYKSIYARPYAVKMNDDSMNPYCIKNDILIVAPRSYIFPVLSSLNPNKLYAVRLNEKDKAGTSIRHCLSKDNILFLRPSVLEYETIGLDLNSVSYPPVAGAVVKIIRT